MKKAAAIIIMCGMFFMASQANAGIGMVVNGDLSDWGVTPGAYGASDWIPDSGIAYYQEDQNTYKVGPGYGGQKFDAEAIYGTRANGFMYLAIVTGHPVTGWAGQKPGDVFFNFGAGRQYGLKTTGVNAGRLYRNPGWNMSPYWGSLNSETTMKDGVWEYMGLTTFVYLNSYVGPGDSNDHWVMEMEAPNSFFGDDWDESGTIHWTQTCGNDAIDLNIPVGHTPEPATMSLLGLGLFGLCGFKFRKRKGVNI